jgi:hypothetical protein
MNRERIIDVLKNGGYYYEDLGGSYERKFLSFGQLSPEVQAVALTIPNDCFEYFRPDGTFAPNDVSPLRKHITYKLVADYIDKPKEPEYEVKKINLLTDYLLDEPDGAHMKLYTAPQYKSFAGYGYRRPDGVIEWCGVAMMFWCEMNKTLSIYELSGLSCSIVRPDFVRFRKDTK